MGKIVLSQEQENTKRMFEQKVEQGIYKLKSNLCICGHPKDLLVSNNDRYGIELRTVLCRNCGLLRSDPYYTPETLSQFYNNEYRLLYTDSKYPTADFFTDEVRIGKNIVKYIEEQVGLNLQGKKVYEIGCGAGGILKAFKDVGAQVFGCDYGSEYIEDSDEHGITLVQGSSEVLSKFGRADIIILNHVFEHFLNPLEELAQIKKLLKPSGLLYISVPGVKNIHNSYGSIRHYLQNAHVYNYTLKTLQVIVMREGFDFISGDEKVRSVFRNSDSSRELIKPDPWLIMYLYTRSSYLFPFLFDLYSNILKLIKRLHLKDAITKKHY